MDITCWESVKPGIRAYLIEKSWNEEYLKGVCYMEYLDLAVVFEVILAENKDEVQTFVVTPEILAQWNVQIEEVYQAAIENMQKEEAVLWNLDELIFGASDPQANDIYVWKGKRDRHGAGVMLCKDVLRKFAQEREKDIYILPSSVHDLILIGKDEKWSAEELKVVVCEINRNCQAVRPEDRLSDSVYLYQRDR